MRLSCNWLREFVDINVSPEILAEKLTLAGFEVEAVEDGRRTYRVVCGAPDVTAGRLYAFAPPGAAISGGREIKAVKLRGVLSEGMLLAEDELGGVGRGA